MGPVRSELLVVGCTVPCVWVPMTNAEIESLLTTYHQDSEHPQHCSRATLMSCLEWRMCLLLIGRRLCASIGGEMITLISHYLLLSLLMVQY